MKNIGWIGFRATACLSPHRLVRVRGYKTMTSGTTHILHKFFTTSDR